MIHHLKGNVKSYLLMSTNLDNIWIRNKILEKTSLFHKYFFNTDFSVTNGNILLKFGPCVDNIHMEGIVSQNLDICSSRYFMTENVQLFSFSFKIIFFIS